VLQQLDIKHHVQHLRAIFGVHYHSKVGVGKISEYIYSGCIKWINNEHFYKRFLFQI